MKKIVIIWVLLLFVSASFSQKNVSKESINNFSFKLFEQLYYNNQNCFFSPFSIFGALSMTYIGSEEATKLEIEKSLEISNGKYVSSEFKNLTSNIQLNREVQFLSSNSIWLQKNFKLDKDYTKNVEENYQAKGKNVDFANENDREKARNEINTLVDKQTKGNILNFIKPGILSDATTMVLINAVYFKSLWHTEFLLKDTKDEMFKKINGDSSKCKMMNNELKTKYFEDNLAQVIEIPYENNRASMIVILPKENEVNNFNKFDYQYLTNSFNSSVIKSVKLSLPAFKMEVDYDLSDALKKMGMKSAFAPGADFSGITGKKDLILSSILHKSILDVSEKGTEASSSTAVIAMRSTSVSSHEPVVFKADHPFLFIIKENATGVILFMGYMAYPN